MTLPPLLARLLIRSGLVHLMPGLQRRLAGGTDYLRYYSDRLLASPLGQLEQIAAGMDADDPDVVNLADGSPRFETIPPQTVRLPADRRGWPPPQGLAELRGAVATRLLADHRLAVSPAEEILITAGALGAMGVVLDAFVNRGDRVVLLDPSSPAYSLLARTRGAAVHWVGTRLDDGRLRLRFDHLTRSMHGARLLVLNSPHNPTGGTIAAEDLEQILWWANRLDVLIVSDEVFARYDDEAVSVGSLHGGRDRTLTVGSVSKSHALAWTRVGWIAAQRHLLRPCLATAALRCPFVPLPSQQIALAALQGPVGGFDGFHDQLEARRRHAFDRLRTARLDPVWPANGLHVWQRVPACWPSGRAFADALLAIHRVRVTPGDLFGPSGHDHVRVSLLADDGRLDEGLNRLVALVTGGHTPAGRSLRRIAV